ncbi:hypothetical protein [Romboutsia lituseburensis]|uniref:hypothetical protein n=1 Tax=Romboutsia lituseburensis TaxID=1537 RepID=UPI00215AEB91|nr:hypothetical protein [Romboutsia lituseburensis]MCR8744380.1 hypothetical protein [Romboutsia lituseburensis]
MTERDSFVVDFINKYKLCTSNHIYKIYFSQVDQTVCKRRLRYLADYGYIQREKYNGNNYIYYSGNKPATRIVAHDLLITNFVVRLLIDGYEIIEFKKSFVLGEVISDAYIRVSKDNRIKNILLEVQLSNHDCLSKYRNLKKLVLDNTKWDVLPRIVVAGNVETQDIPGVKVSYLNLNMEGELCI